MRTGHDDPRAHLFFFEYDIRFLSDKLTVGITHHSAPIDATERSMQVDDGLDASETAKRTPVGTSLSLTAKVT